MPAAPTTHPEPHALEAFALGRLNETERGAVEGHVESCAACCEALAAIGGDSLLDLARDAMKTAAHGETTPIAPDVPAPLTNHPRYRILGKLGAGGMGVVYRAEHRMMGRVVALKVLNPQTIAKPGAIERFHREVKLASRLAHPNIVTAFDADAAGPLHFLVMEFVDGASLDRLVARKGPLPTVMACQFARLAALGLQHAHDKGMIHRDVKPHNLMVSKKGQLKILDFGLARVARTDDAPTSDTMATVTAPEIVLGTPDFLAPEQAQSGKGVDHRADLYSLGCTLFYLLTGRPPFAGATPMEKLIRHVTDAPPDVAALRPDVPAELSAIVTRLMAKEPGARYPSAGELAVVLQPFTKAAPHLPTRTLTPVVLDAQPLSVDGEEVEVPEGETVVENRVEATPVETKRPRRKKVRASWPVRNRLPLALAAAALLLAPLLVWGAMKAASLASTGDEPKGTAGTNKSPPISATGGNPRAVVPPVAAGSDPFKIVIVIPPRELWYRDYGELRERLEGRGAKVQVACSKFEPIPSHPSGVQGPPVRPDRLLANMAGDEADALVFVGGTVDEYFSAKPARDIQRVVARMNERKKVVAGICLGLKVLGKNDLLRDRVVARPSLYDNAEVKRTANANVHVDGLFVSGSRDQDAVEFADAILDTLRRSK